jgi:hypothetical protein
VMPRGKGCPVAKSTDPSINQKRNSLCIPQHSRASLPKHVEPGLRPSAVLEEASALVRQVDLLVLVHHLVAHDLLRTCCCFRLALSMTSSFTPMAAGISSL